MAKATLLFDYKAIHGELLLQMVLWQLPAPSKDRPHGFKYRLYLGRAGQNVVRYDNEAGKGNHRHVGVDEEQQSYAFTTVEELLHDFKSDCEQFGWRWV